MALLYFWRTFIIIHQNLTDDVLPALPPPHLFTLHPESYKMFIVWLALTLTFSPLVGNTVAYPSFCFFLLYLAFRVWISRSPGQLQIPQVAEDGLGLFIPLLPSPGCWDCRPVPPHRPCGLSSASFHVLKRVPFSLREWGLGTASRHAAASTQLRSLLCSECYLKHQHKTDIL